MRDTPVYKQYHRQLGVPEGQCDIAGHLETMYELVVGLNAQWVIELGVRSGVSTTAWLAGLEVTGGSLITVDLHDAPPLEHGEVPWRHFKGNDLALETAGPIIDLIVPDLEPCRPDIVFVDSSHCYQHTLGEIATYGSMNPRVMVFHDMDLEKPVGCGCPDDDPPFPVRRAVEESFASEQILHYNGYNGLAVVKVGL